MIALSPSVVELSIIEMRAHKAGLMRRVDVCGNSKLRSVKRGTYPQHPRGASIPN